MRADELQRFLEIWDREAKKTAGLLRALPADQYDFRPDPGGRSLGELAWHLAEIDAYSGFGIETGSFQFGVRPPGLERPRAVAELAPGYERVHADAIARVRQLRPVDLDRRIRFFDGRLLTIDDLLWEALLFHHLHHRGQLALLCRLAGGVCPSLYGPNREEMAAMRAASGS